MVLPNIERRYWSFIFLEAGKEKKTKTDVRLAEQHNLSICGICQSKQNSFLEHMVRGSHGAYCLVNNVHVVLPLRAFVWLVSSNYYSWKEPYPLHTLELGQQNTMSSGVDVPLIQNCWELIISLLRAKQSTSPGNQRDCINANKQQLI